MKLGLSQGDTGVKDDGRRARRQTCLSRVGWTVAKSVDLASTQDRDLRCASQEARKGR